MDQPLGNCVGNSLEVIECIDVLRGGGPADLRRLCLELCGWMFYLGRKTATVEQGKLLASDLLAGGQALEKFRKIVELQGGDPRLIDDVKLFPRAQHRMELLSKNSGYLASIGCEQVGTAGVVLGGGREKKEDTIDPAVGLVLHKKVGDAVAQGESLSTVWYNSDTRLGEAIFLLENAFRVTNTARYLPQPLVHQVIQPIPLERPVAASAATWPY